MNKIVYCSKISVDCVYNDPVDVKAGGPKFLGFDFFVKTIEEDTMIKFIKTTLNELNIPFMNVHVTGRNLKLSDTVVWSKTNITKSILKDAEMLISESKRYYNQDAKVKRR